MISVATEVLLRWASILILLLTVFLVVLIVLILALKDRISKLGFKFGDKASGYITTKDAHDIKETLKEVKSAVDEVNQAVNTVPKHVPTLVQRVAFSEEHREWVNEALEAIAWQVGCMLKPPPRIGTRDQEQAKEHTRETDYNNEQSA